ncbi:MAG: hypothetical protein LBU65_03035 [Planctomycetaceae bacterium]|jgi:hypothetical protein|nr:hypothetical protein [Planctomycetaceae bacterium]
MQTFNSSKRLSVIIPYFPGDHLETFEGTLVSVLESLSGSTEILVLDAQGYEDTWNIKDEGVRFISLPTGTTEVTGMNVGIRHALGEIIHPLRAGARVCGGWLDEVMPHFENRNVATVIPMLVDPLWQKVVTIGVQLRLNGQIREVRRYKQFLKNNLTFAPHVGAAFFRRSLLEKLGYFDTSFTLQNAYLDYSLLTKLFEYETSVESDCCISLMTERSVADKPTFAAGVEEERLFQRWIDRFNRKSTCSHLSFINTEFCRHLPSPGAFTQLAGRLTTMMSNYDRKEHKEKCEAMKKLFATVPPQQITLEEKEITEQPHPVAA